MCIFNVQSAKKELFVGGVFLTGEDKFEPDLNQKSGNQFLAIS